LGVSSVLDDVSRQYADDLEIVEKLEQAKLYSGLILYSLEPSVAARLKAAINDVASAYGQEPFLPALQSNHTATR
jgi:hypothetical protein